MTSSLDLDEELVKIVLEIESLGLDNFEISGAILIQVRTTLEMAGLFRYMNFVILLTDLINLAGLIFLGIIAGKQDILTLTDGKNVGAD